MHIARGHVNDYTPDELKALVAKHVNVLFKDQDLTKQEYSDLLESLGDATVVGNKFEDIEFPRIYNVTNAPLENGKLGIFADGELHWHCNGPNTEDPEECVVLYCEKPTDKPCKTYVTNGVQAYEDGWEDVKLLLSDDALGFHKLKHEHFAKLHRRPILLDDQRVHVFNSPETKKIHVSMQGRTRGGKTAQRVIDNAKKYTEGGKWNFVIKDLVHTHPVSGEKGFFFPFTSVVGFIGIPEEDWDRAFQYLRDKMLATTRSVDWEKGDLLFFDNTQGLHKRDNIPEGETRELWRGCFWYLED